MSPLSDREKNELDNYITGHWGEDQYREDEQEEEDEPEIDEDKFPWRKKAFRDAFERDLANDNAPAAILWAMLAVVVALAALVVWFRLF